MTLMIPKSNTMSDRFEREDGEFALERAIRRSHCAKTKSGGHGCVGAVTITADRVIFTCQPCGTERVSLNEEHSQDAARADALVMLTRKAITP
jgi:RNase P subunit RPR2